MMNHTAQTDPWQDHEYMDWLYSATDEEVRERLAEALAIDLSEYGE